MSSAPVLRDCSQVPPPERATCYSDQLGAIVLRHDSLEGDAEHHLVRAPHRAG
eukprot:CAMPEP_0171233086 /NCGR_PEP_ID=MMETSP0790-20130122/40739_1 /TAXON_ID=2925 /ORGANISM="Alexandrium catenella, Strain OF101" /LENGTH=52 /DNA_ID=CAMNT_0011699335 /DNA_START=21 /DNA_END=175 /DNA_ORIENTATION=-